MSKDSSEQQASDTLKHDVVGVLKIQCLSGAFIMTLVIIYGVYSGYQFDLLVLKLLACLYGAALAIGASLLTARSVRRSSPLDHEKPLPGQAPVSLVPIFSGLLNKLVIVGGGIGFGLVVLELDPMLVVLSYLFVQISAATQLIVRN